MAVNPPIEQATKSAFGQIIATGVSFEDYLAQYAADFCEWVEGNVIQMSPIHERHDRITLYLAILIAAYFELKPIGQLRREPFVMRLPQINVAREPDLQVILNANRDNLKDTFTDGPADICIEVVSVESIERDHGAKFAEYEKGGVPEYWIVDPLHRESRFYRRNAEGIYERQLEDAEGNYRTPNLPSLVVHVPTLWNDELPGPMAVSRAVQDMLK